MKYDHASGEPPRNQNARREPGAGEINCSQRTPSRTPADSNNKDYEDRRNAAACFKNKSKSEDWHADFLGLMVTENLPTGTRVWVSIRERLTRKGQKYLSVVLKRELER